MKIPGTDIEYRQLSTPSAAAAAGILFSLLFATCLVLIRSVIPEGLSAETNWLETGSSRIKNALLLMPFAGIAFLWFIGSVRDRLGKLEDQFFSTVVLGSGLLFLGMVFVSMGVIGGLVAGYQINPIQILDSNVVFFGRAVMIQLSNVYALRMAGVFMMSLGTIWWRTGLMPRWMVILTYLLSAALLFIINLSLWITLIFPIWVMMISIEILYIKHKKISSMERS
jgi:hypothetical protein